MPPLTSAWNADTGWGLNLRQNDNDDLGFNGSAGDNVYVGGAVDSWTAGEWHQIVLTFDGDEATLYTDSENLGTYPVTSIVDNDAPIVSDISNYL